MSQMDSSASPEGQQPVPVPVPAQQGQSLPPIASLMPQKEGSPIQTRHSAEPRDSGNWSMSHSTHSSGVSNTTGLQLQTILNAEDSPSRSSIPDTPHSTKFASQTPSTLPSLSQGTDPHRISLETSSHFDSRRSSVDSRMNIGMNCLAISPASPYESQNASRVSLASDLRRERGIIPDQRPNGGGPLSPLGPRPGPRASIVPRQAPVINPNPRSVSGPDPRAAEPTPGFAWAFPDTAGPNEPRGSSSDNSSTTRSVSRQNSFATSVNSSIYNNDACLPAGQKRLDDDVSHTHHHSMQHRSVTSLQSNEHTTSTGSGNYSRTPELRISHKMAERKRRSEMKQLFDELNSILPNSPGSKSSKWEILTKSIEYIRNLGRAHDAVRIENARLRPDAELCRRMQEENELLRNELSTVWQHLRRIDPNNPHIYGQVTSMLAQQASQTPNNSSNVLPPIQSAAPWGPPPSAAMQGVEYGSSRAYDPR